MRDRCPRHLAGEYAEQSSVSVPVGQIELTEQPVCSQVQKQEPCESRCHSQDQQAIRQRHICERAFRQREGEISERRMVRFVIGKAGWFPAPFRRNSTDLVSYGGAL